jgi:hypothetical protein
MWNEELNSSIDEIARQMTAATPTGGADFRRRVLARIEAGDAPRKSWRAAFVLAPIAVAIAIAIAVMVVRGPAGPEGPALHTPPLVASGPGETATPGLKGPAPEVGTESPSVAPGHERAAGPKGPSLSAANGSAPAIAVLTVSPLTVDSIAVSPIETDSMPLQKLDAIAPIGVTPLGSPSEGDRP